MESAEPVAERLQVRLAWYAAVAVVTVAYLTYNFRLHHAELSVPLCQPRNDSVALLSLVRTIDESGWPWLPERLGSPGTAERYDYPLPEHAHYLTIRLLVRLTGDPFLAFNLWCLLSYPLTAVCALAVLRAAGVSWPVGFALAIIYTFLPYHAGRVFSHTMLAYYHTVPLVLLPTIWILGGRLPFFGPPGPDGRRPIALWNATTGWTVLHCAVVATTSPYYAFFGCFFLAVAGLYRGLNERSWRPVGSGLATAAVISAIGFACALPFILAEREHGPNPAVAHRHFNEADVYCLKVTELVLPFGGHRVGAIGYVTQVYNAEGIHVNENRDSVLGVVGVAGFVILLVRLLIARNGPSLLGGLAVLNLAALILGASGGLGGLFNFLVFPQIRCYNRVCVFVAFWCLLAVGLLVDRWAARGHSRRAWLAAAGLLFLGLWDVTSQRQAPHHSELQRKHECWSAFVHRMEDALPEGAMVFQLPAVPYPEAGTTYRMPDYAHLACHAYSRNLRWSYGTNRNRRWGEWQQYVAGLPPAEMVRALSLAGFSAVYVDRRGYADNGDEAVRELRVLLGQEVVVSDSREQLLFSLSPAIERMRRYTDAAELDVEKLRLLNRPCVLLQDGFFPWTPAMSAEPRRAMFSASLRLVNPGGAPCRVILSMQWQRHVPNAMRVQVAAVSLGVEQEYSPPSERGPFTLDLELPPGEHVLRFDATPKPVGLPRLFTAWNATEIKLAPKE
ncbi:MAG TPA: hypothetical protein VKD71_02505 [Gemmataceae bacterium]|nr:hypothetical protein [Gemmataceae bacterium]